MKKIFLILSLVLLIGQVEARDPSWALIGTWHQWGDHLGKLSEFTRQIEFKLNKTCTITTFLRNGNVMNEYESKYIVSAGRLILREDTLHEWTRDNRIDIRWLKYKQLPVEDFKMKFTLLQKQSDYHVGFLTGTWYKVK